MRDSPALVACIETRMDGFSLDLELLADAKTVVIFGPSGSGKSLTLRSIAGLRRPDAGMIRLGGRTLFDSALGINLPPQQRRVGFVPQDFALFPHYTIAENIGYGLNRLPGSERRRRVEEMLSLMDLSAYAERLPGAVSGGQQQRTALARALAARPDLLLMDEPFGALDEVLRFHLREEVRRLQQRYAIPVILVTHSLSEAYSLADKLVVLERGRIAQVGPRDLVFRQPVTPAVARLMGMNNILETTCTGLDDDRVLLDWQGIKLRAVRAGQPAIGEPLLVGVRPEEVMIIRHPTSSLGENQLRGSVIEDRPMGFDHLLTIVPEAHPQLRLQLRIAHPNFLKLQVRLGETRVLAIDPQSIHLFGDR